MKDALILKPMNLRETLTLLLLGILSSAAAAAPPALDFKGVQFGVGDAEAVRQMMLSAPMSGWFCFGSPETGDESCRAEGSTFANEPAESMSFRFDDGKLGSVRIMTKPGSFPQIVAALANRYGPPTKRQNSTVKTPMNATYDQSVWTWSLKGRGQIVATLRDDQIDESSVFMISEASVAAFARRKAAEKATKKPDI